jgi:hypothetical protein
MTHWIIQDKIFGEETELLIKQLDDYELVKEIPDSAPEDSIVRGSTDFVQLYQQKFPTHRKWLTIENYSCDTYYPLLGDSLLNSQYLLMNWELLSQNKEIIFSKLEGDKFFIRPNSGRKIFTGTTLTKKWWDKELEIIKNLPNSSVQNHDLVLISTFKEIKAEYRLLMHKHNIIDWSAYNDDEETRIEVDENLFDITKTNNYYPDEYYTLDIAITKYGSKILELNSFVSAGLYNMSNFVGHFQ